jgi:hypothetical protein
VASTSSRLTTEVWHYLPLWYVVIFEKGYPMGYCPFVPLFVPSKLHRVAAIRTILFSSISSNWKFLCPLTVILDVESEWNEETFVNYS